MKYPTLANWIRFKRISEDEYEIVDLLHDKKIKSDAYTVWFVRQLNGKRNPYRIDKNKSKEDIDSLLDKFVTKEIIRDRRFLSKNILQTLITVWKPCITPNLRLFSFIINFLMLISFIPLILFSVVYFFLCVNDISMDYIIFGSISGLLVGLALHELGHMVACLAYGGRIFEVGIGLNFFLPCAYVLMNETPIKKRMRKAQVSAAGIEANLILASICLILATHIESLSGFLLGAAIQNIFLAFLNLTLIDGFDGMSIMNEILGTECIVEKVKRVTKSKRLKKRLKKDGVSGQATIFACYILRTIQVGLPLVVLLNIVGVITWFI